MADNTSNKTKIYDPVDVFISYKRIGGSTVACFLAEEIRKKGLKVFMDVESLSRGDYEEAIFNNIAAANNFILIVTPEVFESENVLKEIEAAVATSKADKSSLQIIPVFVNGLTDFPQNLPASLAHFKKLNAITLNHNNFKGQLKKLLDDDWLITKHNQFIDKWVSHVRKTYDVPWKILLDDLIISFPETKSDIIDFLSRKYRQQWIKNNRNTKKAVDNLVDVTPIDDIKKFLQKSGIEHRGSSNLIKKNIVRWISGDDRQRETLTAAKKEDRYYELCTNLSVNIFVTKARQVALNKICSDLGVELSDKRASWWVLDEYFSQSTGCVSDILAELQLSASDINIVAETLLGSSKGNKEHLISQIAKWVDYEIDGVNSDE